MASTTCTLCSATWPFSRGTSSKTIVNYVAINKLKVAIFNGSFVEEQCYIFKTTAKQT